MNVAQANAGWLVALAFAFALLESLAIVGIFVPGIVLLFIVGAVIGMDAALFLACWMSAAAGAFLGDGVSFWLGRRFSAQVPRIWPLSRRPDMVAASQTLFARHGGMGVFIGRFIGPLRPVVPLVAGTMRLPVMQFLVWAIPACLLWAPLYLLPGMLFGASLELAAEFAGRLAVVLLILVLGTWFVVWVTRLVYEFTARRSSWWLRDMIRWSSRHPYLGRVVGPLFEPGGREVISVALLGLLLLLSMTVLLSVLLTVPFLDTAWDAKRQLDGWAASLRNHFADPFFVVLAVAGGISSMAWLAAATTLLLLVMVRTNAAWHWLAATAGGWLLAWLLSSLTNLLTEQPEVMPSLGEIPLVAFTLVTTVFGFFAVMLAKDLSARRRKWPYLLTSALLGLIGFAHFYLGLASVAGLLAAAALGMAWVALLGIAFRQRAQARRHPLVLALMFYALAVGIAVVHIDRDFAALTEATRLSQPERELSFEAWLDDGWQLLPDRLSRIGRVDRTRFDFQLAADLHEVEQSLVASGWENVTGYGDGLLRALLLRQAVSDQLPHLSLDFAGRPDELMMRRVLSPSEVILVRFWSSGARLEPGAVPVWVGQIRTLRPVRLLGGLNRWQEVYPGQADAQAELEAALDLRLRRRTDQRPALYHVDPVEPD